jgi:hypothetical protein
MTEATAPKPDSLTQLKKRSLHEGVTLPSGAVVTIRLPDLAQMIKSKQLPSELIEAAVKLQDTEDGKPKKLTVEDIEADADFVAYIVPLTIHEPKVKPEDLDDLDPMDKAMVASFATRRTDIDAVGHQLGGLETQKSFRRHRGIYDLDEALGNAT